MRGRGGCGGTRARAHARTCDGVYEGWQSRGEAAKLVLAAEGNRAADILRAKGTAEAKARDAAVGVVVGCPPPVRADSRSAAPRRQVLIAKSESASIEALQGPVAACGMRAVDYLAAVEYLNALSRLSAGAETKVVLIPSETVDSIARCAPCGRGAGGRGGGVTPCAHARSIAALNPSLRL